MLCLDLADGGVQLKAVMEDQQCGGKFSYISTSILTGEMKEERNTLLPI